MDLISIAAFLGVGILFVVIALVIRDRPKKEIEQYDQVSEKKSELNDLIDEADKMIKELHSFSDYIIKELETKHKELLFLYQLVEEKQKQVYNEQSFERKQPEVEKPKVNPIINPSATYSSIAPAIQAYNNNLTEVQGSIENDAVDEESLEQIMKQFFSEKNIEVQKENVEEEPQKLEEEDNVAKIMRMYQQGYEIQDIAEKLRMGKGEIQLIIQLNKKR